MKDQTELMVQDHELAAFIGRLVLTPILIPMLVALIFVGAFLGAISGAADAVARVWWLLARRLWGKTDTGVRMRDIICNGVESLRRT